MKENNLKLENYREIKLCNLTSTPLLRFKHRKRQLRKKKLKRLSGNSLEPVQTRKDSVDCRMPSHSQLKTLKKLPNPISNLSEFFCEPSANSALSTSSRLSKIKASTVLNYGKPFIVKLSSNSKVTGALPFHCTKQNVKGTQNLPLNYINPKSGKEILIKTIAESNNIVEPACFGPENSGFLTNKTLVCVEETLKNTSNTKQVGLGFIERPSGKVSESTLLTKSNMHRPMSKPAFNIYELNGSKSLVVVKAESIFYFVGTLELELVEGHIEVFGHRFTNKNKKILIFSLYGSCHLFLKTKANDHRMTHHTGGVTLANLISIGLSEKSSKEVLKEIDDKVLFVISRRSDHISSSVWPLFSENHLSFSIFPSNLMIAQETRLCHETERKMDCLFEENSQDLNLKTFVELPEWSVTEKDITSLDSFKIVLCGGKSVGKSTLLRYLVNKSLQKWKKVLVVDFDLGQCEFTVPGCISVTLVEEPLLGPNYSHLKEPLRSVFLGEVDVTKCPECYIKGCQFLIDYAKQEHINIPWFINTMGFTRGFGVTLTCGIIHNLNPTHVVQIESKNRKLNFPAKLHPGFVYSHNDGSFERVEQRLDYLLYTIPSGPEQQEKSTQTSRGMSPAEARTLVILSYLSEMLSSEMSSLTQVAPHMVDLNQVQLHTIDKYDLTKHQIAATMNGNMVALCSFKDGDKFPNCHGFGIVRGIDWKTETIYLITPVSSALSKVNCLIKGNIALPESLYYNQGKEVIGQIPYLAHTSGRQTSRFAKRDFRATPLTRGPNQVTSNDRVFVNTPSKTV